MATPPNTPNSGRRAVLLQAAAHVAKNIATILDLETLLPRTVDIICDAYGFYYAGVFLLDAKGKWAVLKAGRGAAGAAMLSEGHRLPVGDSSMIGAAIQHREARIALDVSAEAAHFKNPHLPNTRSEMALPLIVGDTVLGALTVQSEQATAFSQDDISALQALADQLAIAIDNARLHGENATLIKQMARRTKLLALATEMGKQVTSILDLETLLPRMVDLIVETYGYYYAGVFLIDASGNFAELRAGYGVAGDAMVEAGHKLAVGGQSMIGAAIRQRKARIALDVGAESIHFRNPHLPNTHSEMALPLMVGDNVLGAVTIQSEQQAAFTTDDIQSLQAMADTLAVAINNALTLKALERANAELLRTKTYEALATATTEAIHWIGNKALPITTTVARVRNDLTGGRLQLAELAEDLDLIDESAQLIVQVKEALIGQAREQKPRPTMVDDVVRMAAHLLQLPAAKVQITNEISRGLVWADSTQLTRAFVNLLQNADEAGANNIHVTIAPAPTPDFLVVTLQDDGQGIAPDQLNKIWAAFYSTRGSGHNGLGLSACLHIISQLGGTITVESTPGAGTSFRVLLPAVESETRATPINWQGVPESLVLIANDEPWARWVVATLSAAGKQINHYSSVPMDLEGEWVLMDEALNGQPVGEALIILKVTEKHERTLILTAAQNVERATQFLVQRVRDVVLKPYTPAELATMLRGLT